MPNRACILKQQFLQSVASPGGEAAARRVSPGASSEGEDHLLPKHLHTDSHLVGDDIPGTRARQKFESSREADEYVVECGRSQVSFF